MNIVNLLIETSRHAVSRLRLSWFRQKVWHKKRGSIIPCLGYRIRTTDGPNFYMQYKDEFINRIYHFDSQRPDPFIIDGGSNVGMSILYFKHIYPKARIIGFEPDPTIFGFLSENLQCNKIADVQLVNSGLSKEDSENGFIPDGQAGGRLNTGGQFHVRTERLSKYLDRDVDFLKLNIEGAELSVLTEVANAGRLRNVRELVLEYHGWPGQRQLLGDILSLLDHQGFRYLVHDFDNETGNASKPPFHLDTTTAWFCLIYAKQNDMIAGKN